VVEKVQAILVAVAPGVPLETPFAAGARSVAVACLMRVVPALAAGEVVAGKVAADTADWVEELALVSCHDHSVRSRQRDPG